MKVGYKGFDSNLCCRGEQFIVGEIYTKPEVDTDKLITCTNKGYHYCDTLEETFKYYSDNNTNRFCKIEILGNYKRDSYDGKAITTSFRIIKEIDFTERKRKKLQTTVEGLPLELMTKLQKLYPLFYGGSTALLLYGCNLWRKIGDSGIDLDIILPYYVKIRKQDLLDAGIPIKSISEHGAKASGNDFDQTISLEFDESITRKKDVDDDLFEELQDLSNYLKLDIKIDPKQSYNIVKYKDYELKLSQVEPILEAKIKYAQNGQNKHREDIYDLLGINLNKIE